MIIDIHAHYIPQLVFDRFEREASKFPGVALTRDDKGVRIGFVGKDLSRPIMPKLSALADRRAWMDANGIDHQLVGAWMDATGYELSVDALRQLRREAPAAAAAITSAVIGDVTARLRTINERIEQELNPTATARGPGVKAGAGRGPSGGYRPHADGALGPGSASEPRTWWAKLFGG